MSEHKKEKRQPDSVRRQFLKGMGIAAAATASVVSGTVRADMVVTNEEASEPKTKGYRETQHIRDYYDTL